MQSFGSRRATIPFLRRYLLLIALPLRMMLAGFAFFWLTRTTIHHILLMMTTIPHEWSLLCGRYAPLRLQAIDVPSALSLHYSGEAEGPSPPFAIEMRHVTPPHSNPWLGCTTVVPWQLFDRYMAQLA